MSRKRNNKVGFGAFIATGVLVFLLSILGIDVSNGGIPQKDTEKLIESELNEIYFDEEEWESE